MKFERTKKEANARKKFEPTREKYEREEREERERREEEEKREWCERQKQYKINVLREQFLYIEKVYGKNCINRKLARMDRDEYEIYKARKYVRNENANGHECYNGIEGKKLWINREMWKNMHDRK